MQAKLLSAIALILLILGFPLISWFEQHTPSSAGAVGLVWGTVITGGFVMIHTRVIPLVMGTKLK